MKDSTARNSTSTNSIDDYISAAELARQHDISMSTLRRKTKEGRLFPGARKAAMPSGELWLIPHAEAQSVKLEQISPRIHRQRMMGHRELNSLNARLTRLEKMAEKLLL